MRVTEGESVAITGPSGSGKTTVSKLLLSLYPVIGGEWFLNGKSCYDLSNSEIRSQIAYVPQEPYLFHESIKENIRIGKPDATDEEIVNAAKMAYAHEFIMQLENGYDTNVGERGNNLSGGQKQRIAIARAILKEAPIILLDEATSALDNESERLVNEALKQMKNKKTILCAAELLKNELNIKEENVAEGLKNVVELTSLMGRWQKLSSSPLIIADTGHNVAGMQYIVSQIADIKAENKRLVIGMVGDKDITSMLKLLPKDAIYYFCNAQIPRALPAEELKRKASEFGLKGNAYPSVSDALDSAKRDASTNDFIFVGGSNFTVAEIITPNS